MAAAKPAAAAAAGVGAGAGAAAGGGGGGGSGKSEYVFKVGLLGSANVGKTSLVQRARDETCAMDSQPTVGVEQVVLHYQLAGTRVTLKVLDTSGQERFQSMTAQWVRDCQAYVLCYSLDALSSAHALTQWLEFIEGASGSDTKPKPLFVVGNKCDLTVDDAPQIEQTRAVAQAFVASHGDSCGGDGADASPSSAGADEKKGNKVSARHINAHAAHIETSALSNIKVVHLFESVATRLIARAFQNLKDTRQKVDAAHEASANSSNSGFGIGPFKINLDADKVEDKCSC